MKKSLYLQFVLIFLSVNLWSQDALFQETNLNQVYSEYQLDGTGVIVAIMDRGIDYTHPDFQNADGTTRILGVFDLSNNAGANDPNNPYGVGTILSEDDINTALVSGGLLTRDAVGHGTITAGIATGNGAVSNGAIKGVAPKASIVIVKFTSEGAPAHGTQPAEVPFYNPINLEPAIQFVESVAADYNMPYVLSANFGSAGDSMDGSSVSCRTIDTYFGSGKKGKVFLTGSSDDGGIENHAQFNIAAGSSQELMINKADNNFLRLSAWYLDTDRLDIEIVLPDGTSTTYPAFDLQTDFSQVFESAYNYYHNGSQADFSQSDNNKREILIDLLGPAGVYKIKFIGVDINSGRVDAWLNPSNIFAAPDNKFLNHVVEGYTIWDWATATSNISFNAYILTETYRDLNGVTRTGIAGNDAGIGNLWPGSGVGPSLNGSIAVSVPGNIIIGPYSQHSYWSTLDFILLEGEDRKYGTLAAVSGANPVITGVVALMLQADPELDSEEIRTILQETAREDAQTGVVPNPEWGHGKLDAYAAVRRALGISEVEDYTISKFNVWPNPSDGFIQIPKDYSDRELVYKIYNLEGKIIVDGLLLNDPKIDISILAKGFYQLSIYSKNDLLARSSFVKK